MNSSSVCGGGLLRKASLISFLVSAAAYCAPVTVVSAVTPNGLLFHYNYTITNPTGNDLPILDIFVNRGAGTILNLVAPTGFQKQFDSVLGIVSFLENTSSFGPAGISGFMFDSPIGPRAGQFDAHLLDSNFNLTDNFGSTSTPSTVPEPAYFPALILSGAAVLLIRARRGSRQSSTN